jgi:1-acyl-sn-glycerol-3-phosphate acyltransferase
VGNLMDLGRRRRERRQARLVQPFDWALTAPARSLRSDVQDLVLFPIVRYFAKVTTEGQDHFDEVDGPAVLVSNHTSHLDCPVILSALPRRVRRRTIVAAAADYFWKVKALGAVTSLALGTVPFKRRDGSRQSIERLKEGLRRGWSVLMFPEGGRSRTGKLGQFKQGAAYICLDTHSAAVPIYIEGAHRLMPKGSSLPKQGEVLVRFGPPIKPRPGDDYASFTARLEDAILDLAGARTSRAG